MFFNLPTLYFQLLTTQLLFAVVHAMTWQAHPKEKTLLFWAVANILGASTALNIMVHATHVGESGDFHMAVAGNLLFVFANVAQWLGVRHMLGKPLKLVACAAALAAVALGLIVLKLTDGPLWLRSVAVSVLAALIAGLQLRDLMLAPKILGVSLLRVATVIHLGFYALRVANLLEQLPTSELQLDRSGITGWTLYESLLCLLMANLSYLMILSERQKRSLNKLALTDPLTGLLNRRAFTDQSLALSGSGGAILMLDIDRFKAVNDTYGHATGDLVLTGFAQLLRQQLRTHDIVARTGGEEFSILLPGTSMDAAVLIAERIREACASALFIDGLRVTVSAGLTQLLPTDSLEIASARADRALYAAKRQGRNCVQLAAA